MRIVTDAFRKLATNWDDQAGFVDRDMNSGGIGQAKNRGTEGVDEILARWEERKRRRRARRLDEDADSVVRIYQLGLESPLTQREEAKPLLNL